MPQRVCDSCHQIDEDPRHVYGVAGDENENSSYTADDRAKLVESAGGDNDKLSAVFAAVEDRATRLKHLDCCLADGCPDGTCDARLEDKDDPFDGGKTTGSALRKKFAKLNEEK